MGNLMKHQRGSLGRLAYTAWCLLLALAPPALAQAGLPGDINLDGQVNVLDVQGTVNMALGDTSAREEADVDASATVDVVDVQNVTNTALGTGGLIQEVRGRINLNGQRPQGALEIVAISADGRRINASVEGHQEEFVLHLPVQTSWAFGVLLHESAGIRGAGSFGFVVLDQPSLVLPLPSLSTSRPLDLGPIPLWWGATLEQDLRTVLANVSEPLDQTDENENNLPDVVEQLLVPFPEGGGLDAESVAALDATSFTTAVSQCLARQGTGPLHPDLTGIEEDGIPQFLAPVLGCVDATIQDWLIGALQDPAAAVVYGEYYRSAVRGRIERWLGELSRPEVTDANGNAIPDHIEPAICIHGSSSPACHLDTNHDAIPDFMADADGDTIPNVTDPDNGLSGDGDGDSIPDEMDIDSDNDGLPNYADSEPLDRALK